MGPSPDIRKAQLSALKQSPESAAGSDRRSQALHELQGRHHAVGGGPVVPSRIQFKHDLPAGIAMHAFVGPRGARNVALRVATIEHIPPLSAERRSRNFIRV